jgi:hypothetical protein
MCGQNKAPLDSMLETLLNGQVFNYLDFEVRLVDNQRNYEVFNKGIKIGRFPANWSTYFEIENMLMDE